MNRSETENNGSLKQVNVSLLSQKIFRDFVFFSIFCSYYIDDVINIAPWSFTNTIWITSYWWNHLSKLVKNIKFWFWNVFWFHLPVLEIMKMKFISNDSQKIRLKWGYIKLSSEKEMHHFQVIWNLYCMQRCAILKLARVKFTLLYLFNNIMLTPWYATFHL